MPVNELVVGAPPIAPPPAVVLGTVRVEPTDVRPDVLTCLHRHVDELRSHFRLDSPPGPTNLTYLPAAAA